MDEKNSIESSGELLCRPRERTRQRWHALIAEQSASGLEIAAFCRQRSIATSSFYCWRRKLAEPEQQANGAFLPVRLGKRVRMARSGSSLEVRLRGGRGVAVPDSFDRDLLVELIDVLEGLA
jgi:hypothetical protein